MMLYLSGSQESWTPAVIIEVIVAIGEFVILALNGLWSYKIRLKEVEAKEWLQSVREQRDSVVIPGTLSRTQIAGGRGKHKTKSSVDAKAAPTGELELSSGPAALSDSEEGGK